MNTESTNPAVIKDYIGDGVYAYFDGYAIRMTTENGISVQNEIYLEPSVLDAFMRFVERVKNNG